LRQALSAHVPGRGSRYEVGLKARAIAFANERRAEGRTWASIAEELGLRFETLRRWCTPARSSRSMRAVEVIDEAPSSLSIASPSGLRIEGATLEQAIALLRALG
jgi:hypothetical protein